MLFSSFHRIIFCNLFINCYQTPLWLSPTTIPKEKLCKFSQMRMRKINKRSHLSTLVGNIARHKKNPHTIGKSRGCSIVFHSIETVFTIMFQLNKIWKIVVQPYKIWGKNVFIGEVNQLLWSLWTMVIMRKNTVSLKPNKKVEREKIQDYNVTKEPSVVKFSNTN